MQNGANTNTLLPQQEAAKKSNIQSSEFILQRSVKMNDKERNIDDKHLSLVSLSIVYSFFLYLTVLRVLIRGCLIYQVEAVTIFSRHVWMKQQSLWIKYQHKVNYFFFLVQEGSKIKISGQKIFRGKDVGEMAIDADHKRDWRLVPRHEEQMFLSAKTATREPVVIKDTTPFPPLLERMIRRDLKAAGKECSEPLELKLDIRQHRLNHAILESELRTWSMGMIEQQIHGIG